MMLAVLWLKRMLYFNSIKVQLKPIISLLGITAPTVFQFHKGTIKTTCRKCEEGRQTLFQFHKGTIKTSELQSFNTVVPNEISIP